jgi:hypothetical protein
VFFKNEHMYLSHRASNAERFLEEPSFIAYRDEIGEVDGAHCLNDWKTTTGRYADAPDGLRCLNLNGLREFVL